MYGSLAKHLSCHLTCNFHLCAIMALFTCRELQPAPSSEVQKVLEATKYKTMRVYYIGVHETKTYITCTWITSKLGQQAKLSFEIICLNDTPICNQMTSHFLCLAHHCKRLTIMSSSSRCCTQSQSFAVIPKTVQSLPAQGMRIAKVYQESQVTIFKALVLS